MEEGSHHQDKFTEIAPTKEPFYPKEQSIIKSNSSSPSLSSNHPAPINVDQLVNVEKLKLDEASQLHEGDPHIVSFSNPNPIPHEHLLHAEGDAVLDLGAKANPKSTDHVDNINNDNSVGDDDEEEDSPDIMIDDELLQPIALLVDELRSESTLDRVEAIHRLSTIALALGQERTKKELLPFLLQSLDDEDEVLTAIAEELDSKFLEYIGGPKYGHLLIPILEGLASADEIVVRKKAVESFQSLINCLSSEQLKEYMLPALKNLSSGDWFSKKTSAAPLCAMCAPFLGPEEIKEIRSIFKLLIFDESTTVRKAAISNLTQIIKLSSEEICCKEFVPLVSQVTNDPQDSVRIYVIEPFIALCEQISNNQSKASLLFPIYLTLSADRSWRIRHVLSSHFGELARAIQTVPPNSQIDPIKTFCALLRDPEPEVRTAAASKLAQVTKSADRKEIDNLLIPAVRIAATDACSHVKGALALQLNQFSLVIGQELTLQYVLPLVIQLLRDESSEVRLNVISGIEITVSVIGIDELEHTLMPAVSKLSTDTQWRVRQTTVEYMPNLAKLLGLDRFDASLADLILSWLEDPVFEVRKTAAKSVAQIIATFGLDWAFKSASGAEGVIPRLLAMATHPNYLRRQILILTIVQLTKVLTVEQVVLYLLPVLQRLSTDPISNVKFSVAKAFENVLPILLPSNYDAIRNVVLPSLQQLQLDSDTDVQFFAERALGLVPSV